MRDRVALAREHGFLTRPWERGELKHDRRNRLRREAPPGQGGGEAGPELLKWREETEQEGAGQ